MLGFLLFFGVLKGLGSSGRLIGSGSTYPGTYKSSPSRVMAKNPPWGIFFRVRYPLIFLQDVWDWDYVWLLPYFQVGTT